MTKLFRNLIAHSTGNGLRAQLLRGSVGSFAVKIATTILSMAVSMALARSLGPKKYGVYVYALALTTILGVPAQMGLPSLVVREVAAYQVKQQWGLLKGVLQRVFQSVLLMSGILAIGAGGIVWCVAERFSHEDLTTLGWALALLPIISLGNIRGAALRGLRKVVQGQLPEFVLRPIGFLLAIAVTLFFFPDQPFTPSKAMFLHVIAASLAFGIGAWLLYRAIPQESNAATPEYETRRWAASALPLSLIAGTNIINKQTDIVMLGLFLDSAAVGVYRVACQSALLLSFGLQAINLVLAPHFSRLYAERDMFRLQKLVTTSARAILGLTLLALLTLVFFGKMLIVLAFGKEFALAYGPMLVLAVGQLVNGAMGSVGVLLNMTGFERISAQWLALASALNIILNFLLIPRLGINGAALATSCTLVVWNLLLWQAVRKHLGIDSTAFNIFIFDSRTT